MTNFDMYINNMESDQAYGTSGVDFIPVDFVNDSIIFTNGSDIVKPGAPVPSANQLNKAGILIEDYAQIISEYLLADDSENLLQDIPLAGDNDAQYVFAVDFDGITTSEPVLQVWDNTDLNTIDNVCLGEGNSTQSWYYGVVTTNGKPGSGWLGTNPSIGKPLAGSMDSHSLFLNDGNGALDTAKTLYFQLKIIVPADVSVAGAEQPVIVIKYTTN